MRRYYYYYHYSYYYCYYRYWPVSDPSESITTSRITYARVLNRTQNGLMIGMSPRVYTYNNNNNFIVILS